MLQGVDPSILTEQNLTDEQILGRRYCYCPKGDEASKRLRALHESQGVPKGFCGKCQVCDEPGHVCHYPGPLPFTGRWCDKHYLIEVREKPMLTAIRERRKLNFRKKDKGES